MKRLILGVIVSAFTLSWSTVSAEVDVTQLLQKADSLVSQADYDSALAIELVALEVAEQRFGPDDTLVAKVLMYIGAELCGFGRFEKAREHWERALEIRKVKMGTEHPRVADCQMNLGIVCQRMQDYEQSKGYFQSAYRIILNAFGPEHPKTVRSVQNLFGFYQHVGMIDSAAAYGELAVSTSRAVYGPNHFETAINLANLAVLQIDMLQLDLAEINLEEAIAILDRISSTPATQLQQAVFLNNLGNVYSQLSKHLKAIDSYRRALVIRESLLGSEHPEVAVTLGNLANTYVLLGEWKQAEEMNLRALDSFEKFYGANHTELTGVLVNLGTVCRKQGELHKSREYYERALRIRREVFGHIHPKVATVLYNLATLSFLEGKVREAKAHQEEALDIRRNLFGNRSPSVAECLEHLSHLHLSSGDYLVALQVAVEAESIRRQHLTKMSAALSEREALSFSISHRQSLGNLTGCYLQAPEVTRSQFCTLLVDALVSSKGMITDQMSQVYKWVAQADDSIAVRLVDELKDTRGVLANLYAMGSTDDMEKFRLRVDSLQSMMEECEAQLVQVSERYRQELRQMNVSASELSALLPTGACLIEYFLVDIPTPLDPETLKQSYLALLLKPDSKVYLQNLGSADVIDSLANKLHEHMRQVARTGNPNTHGYTDYNSVASSLVNRILFPLKEHLPENALVLIAPDGTLNTVSFAALPIRENVYFIEEYTVHYISAGRDLIRFNRSQIPGEGLLAVGDPDFDAVHVASSQPSIAASETPRTESGVIMRQVFGDCGKLRDLLASPLPSTAEEVQTIANYWNMHASTKPLILTGVQANEQDFKQHAPGKRAIHIATHGFFLGRTCATDGIDKGKSRQLLLQGDNPLLFSGLLLAGANRRLFGETISETAEDGLLTALEVSTLNLSGTRLVVLSACETGLGTVEDGEGLFGLKRAFHLAGVSTVISSLWAVPDESTSAILGSLYSSQKDILPKRLRDLQVAFVNRMRAKGDTDHPFTWGAFTIQGDWRNLQD